MKGRGHVPRLTTYQLHDKERRHMAIASNYPLATGNPNLASQPQINFACDLLDQRDLTQISWVARHGDLALELRGDMDRYARFVWDIKQSLPAKSKANISSIIDALKQVPKKDPNWPDGDSYTESQRTWEPEHFGQDEKGKDIWAMTFRADGMGEEQKTVPRGSYALETKYLPGTDYENEINFYSVWISDDGSRWTVRQYLSDERVKLPRRTQYMILSMINQDAAAAAALYGHKIGKCGVCGRKLTNDASRTRGIGPVCAERWGW